MERPKPDSLRPFPGLAHLCSSCFWNPEVFSKSPVHLSLQGAESSGFSTHKDPSRASIRQGGILSAENSQEDSSPRSCGCSAGPGSAPAQPRAIWGRLAGAVRSARPTPAGLQGPAIVRQRRRNPIYGTRRRAKRRV